MLLTEADARSKWCPEARVVRRESLDPNSLGRSLIGGVNRDALGRSPDPTASCRCIASGCAMWRWLDAPALADKRRGFCGLAGTPVDFDAKGKI